MSENNQYIEGLNEYSINFKQGYNDTRFEDFDDVIFLDEPPVDYSSLSSIGYYDGYMYGIYLVKTFQTNNVHNLEAVIDKYHTQALKRQENYIANQNNGASLRK